MNRKFITALRPYMEKRLEEIKEADILVGIPCFNNEDTIVHVIQMVSHGLFKHYRNLRSVILVADGGSTDDTRDRAYEFQLKPWQEKLITIYRGIGGKGSALRGIFESAFWLKVKACACVDSDLRSITPDWIHFLLDPVLEKDYQFVAPVYSRYKYDGTITNNIVYNMVRTLYGKRIRQPIGGDFAFSRYIAKHFLEQDVWTSDIARYGIDIWMTTTALVEKKKVCQANLGVKIHDVKDPSVSLGPMFRQVCGTLFALMSCHESFWKDIKGSHPVPTFGMQEFFEPEPIEVNQPRMVKEFQEGMRLFGILWKEIFSEEVFKALMNSFHQSPEKFTLPVEIWVKVLFELAAKYHHMTEHRIKLLSLMTPIYLARVASFINQTRDMNSAEAEELVEEQAQIFENQKDLLIDLWFNSSPPESLESVLSE